MEPFAPVTSPVHPLFWDDVDTDQIIPARFLKVTDRACLGAHLFADRPEALSGAGGRSILLAGENFGCGSSREHAAWALVDRGFRVVVARSFADIFRANALQNGLLPVALLPADHDELRALVLKEPEVRVVVDLDAQRVRLPDGRTFTFPVEPFAKCCLLAGMDELEYLTSMTDRITAFELELRGKEI